MKTVYLAGKFSDKAIIKGVADKIKEKGFEITAEWYNDVEIPKVEGKDWYKESEVMTRFMRDFFAIDTADIFILCLGDGQDVIGGYVELGIAYVFDFDNKTRMKKLFQKPQKKRFILVGKPLHDNIMLYPMVERYDTVDEMLGKL